MVGQVEGDRRLLVHRAGDFDDVISLLNDHHVTRCYWGQGVRAHRLVGHQLKSKSPSATTRMGYENLKHEAEPWQEREVL